MPDWDADSPQLRQNLRGLLLQIQEEARLRIALNLDRIRQWHRLAMQDLIVPDPAMVGKFRGEQGLEEVEVPNRDTFGDSSEENC